MQACSLEPAEDLVARIEMEKQPTLIFSGEYTKAMDENYHKDHLACHNCDKKLVACRYIVKDENPHCIPCYQELYAHNCEECKKPIGPDYKDLSYKDRHWHEFCFKCCECQKSLVDQPFAPKNDNIYCSDCHDKNFAARCDGCGEPFRGGMKKFEYKGKQWHEECFVCMVCKQPIRNKSFIPRENEAVCVPCYEEQFAQKCSKCNGVINKGGVAYKNQPWHRECFTCTKCSKELAKEKFTSKDDQHIVPSVTESCSPRSVADVLKPSLVLEEQSSSRLRIVTGTATVLYVTNAKRRWSAKVSL